MSRREEERRAGVDPIAARDEQARREVGRTVVSRAVAIGVAVFLLLTAFGVLAVEQGRAAFDSGRDRWPAWGELRDRLAGGLRETGLRGVNHALLAEIDSFEERMDEGSVVVASVVPWAQWAETAWLGTGNRRAYVGSGGWLFYRPDVAYVTGPPFLDPEVLESRREGGDSWEEPTRPDPRPAIVAFARQLAGRGIGLMVLPTPVKPMIHPERLAGDGRDWKRPLQNPSFPRLVRDLEAAGVEVFDPAPLLARAADGTGEPQYLATDTHWAPDAVDRVARALADRLAGRLGPAPGGTAYSRRPVAVNGTGDLARMLRLPGPADLFPPQAVTLQMVTRPDGALWRPEAGAPVLLLGDSFTNVFSQAELGWGRGGGLAEQLSYHLGRPLDRIAVNAGGSHTNREALARALATDPDRLDGVRVVVYQFAVRELSAGDWKPVKLPHDRVYSPAAPGPRSESRTGAGPIPGMDVLFAPRSSRLLEATLGLCLVSASLACGAGGSAELGAPEPGEPEGDRAPSPDRASRSLEGPPDEGFVVWESNRTGNWRLWYRRLDGSGLRRLTREEAGRQHCCPHISPDGTRLVYLSRAAGRDKYPKVEVPGELRLLSLGGGGERTVVPAARTYGWGDRAAVWRSDRELIYVGGDGRTFLLDLDRGVSHALTSEPRETLGWLIDATLSHATTAAPSFSLYDAGSRRVIERSELSGCEPYFSHDGRWGFWIPGAGGPIERMELATREVSSILVKDDPRLGDKRYMYFPMLSRDGRRLAFGASDGDHSHFEADYDIFVVPTDPETLDLVGPPLRVTTDPATDRYPDVFPPRRAPRRREASPQGPRPEKSEDSAAPWPATRDGLVFLWRTGDSPNLIHDPELGAERAYNLEARGRAHLDHDWAMVLGGGALVAPPEAARNLLAAVRRSDELTVEATVTPTKATPRGLRSIVAFASPGGEPNLVLGQEGRHLVALLRTAGRAPAGGWPVERLFEVAPGEPTHVVLTYADGGLVAYRDGEPVVESGVLGGRLAPHWKPGELWLGSEVGGGGDWAGTLEGIALYGRALDPATVRENAARYRRMLAGRPEVPRVTVRARLVRRSEVPTLRKISPYRRALAVYEHEVVGPSGHELQGRRIPVARWVILDGETLPAARYQAGRLERLVLEPFEANHQLEGVFLSDTLEGSAGGTLYYAVDTRKAPDR